MIVIEVKVCHHFVLPWGELEDVWLPRYIFRRNAIFGSVLYYELPGHQTGDLLVPKPRAAKFLWVRRFKARQDI